MYASRYQASSNASSETQDLYAVPSVSNVSNVNQQYGGMKFPKFVWSEQFSFLLIFFLFWSAANRIWMLPILVLWMLPNELNWTILAGRIHRLRCKKTNWKFNIKTTMQWKWSKFLIERLELLKLNAPHFWWESKIRTQKKPLSRDDKQLRTVLVLTFHVESRLQTGRSFVYLFLPNI